MSSASTLKWLSAQSTSFGSPTNTVDLGWMGTLGGRKDAYDILLFDKAGKTRVYASR